MGDNRHPRQRVLVSGRLPVVERAKAGNEALGISAPVRMMRPDELPTAPPDFARRVLVMLVADACHVAPLDGDGDDL
jgi:hypothetical protein